MKRFNLKMFREKLGLTQQQMADTLEVSKSYYVMVELGKTDPSFKLAEKIHEVYGSCFTDIWELLKKGV